MEYNNSTEKKIRIAVVGSTCLDRIQPQTSIKGKTQSRNNFGGIIYVMTALSALAKDKVIIYPVTKLEKKYQKDFFNLLQQYPNIKTDYIVDEPGKTNIVNLKYDKQHKNRIEKSILKATKINYQQIAPVFAFADIIVISYISGYDVSLQVLKRIRENYQGLIYGDIHTFILNKPVKGFRNYRKITNYAEWIKNFDIIQGSEIEWEIILKQKFKNLNLTNTDLKTRLKVFKDIAKYVLSLGVKKILMTMGKDGVVGCEKEKGKIKTYYIKGKIIKNIKDTTGCGDTLQAGFLAGMALKYNFKESLMLGNDFARLKARKTGFFKYENIHLAGIYEF